jgi:ABC-2 type transport system ATP-binding protein
MIEVEGLTKRYGAVYAIRDLTFSVAKGEVVGFLGPNGAGKSTTMRIIAGSLGASKGRAVVGQKDVSEEPRAVQSMLGYAPETPPLYTNMTVWDYVSFAAVLKGVADSSGATRAALAKVGLTSVAGRLIENLSKGYRQRVGLAQALVHDPQVLILDEPTSGLDPKQRVEIRDLIAELAKGERTVLLSTHVLGEIETICNRVIIINRGVIVSQELLSDLGEAGRVVRVMVARDVPGAIQAFRSVPGATSVDEEGGFIVARGDDDLRERIAAAAIPFGLLELNGRRRLEDVYLEKTRGDAPGAGQVLETLGGGAA